MHLKSISLFNYKNIAEQSFLFDAKINSFLGKNGVGKTNILDAIYNLANGKSYFNPLALQNIRHGEEFYLIDGIFEKQHREENIVSSFKKGQKKILKRNGKLYDKLSEHIGFVPLVILSPSDNDLISEGSETRRKFIDTVISQLDAAYLHKIIQYQKTLSQRNALLKYFGLNRVFEKDTLEIYDEQLHEFGSVIFDKRKEFIAAFIPIFNSFYQRIAHGAEEVSLVYESHLLEKNTLELLQENVAKDLALHYTSVGIHKDDLSFRLGDYSIKKFGSQGQQKSFLIALKLAQFEFVKKKSGEKPILLFDDIFDKLDEFRVEQIIQMVNNNDFGQLFITDTHANRTEEILKKTNQSYKLFPL